MFRLPPQSMATTRKACRAGRGGRSAPDQRIKPSVQGSIEPTPASAARLRPVINGLAAADIVLVPLGASFVEFDSTGRFFDMLHSTFASIEEGENMTARALGRPEMAFEWDAVQAVITRYDGSQQAEMAALMQAYLGRTLSP